MQDLSYSNDEWEKGFSQSVLYTTFQNESLQVVVLLKFDTVTLGAHAPPVMRQTGLMSGHQPSKIPIIKFLQLKLKLDCSMVLFPVQCMKLKSFLQSNLSHVEASCFIHGKWPGIQFYRMGWLLTWLVSIAIFGACKQSLGWHTCLPRPMAGIASKSNVVVISWLLSKPIRFGTWLGILQSCNKSTWLNLFVKFNSFDCFALSSSSMLDCCMSAIIVWTPAPEMMLARFGSKGYVLALVTVVSSGKLLLGCCSRKGCLVSGVAWYLHCCPVVCLNLLVAWNAIDPSLGNGGSCLYIGIICCLLGRKCFLNFSQTCMDVCIYTSDGIVINPYWTAVAASWVTIVVACKSHACVFVWTCSSSVSY